MVFSLAVKIKCNFNLYFSFILFTQRMKEINILQEVKLEFEIYCENLCRYVCGMTAGTTLCTQLCLAIPYKDKQPRCSRALFVKYAKFCAYSKSLFTLFVLEKTQRDSLKNIYFAFLEVGLKPVKKKEEKLIQSLATEKLHPHNEEGDFCYLATLCLCVF